MRPDGRSVAGRVTAAGFRLASRVRGTKVFHPHGVVHEATVRVGDAGVLAEPGTYDALVRFSRGAGLPSRLPDALGIGLRLLDAHGRGRHQDFLLITSGDGPVVQHLLLPARTFGSLPYSSVLPYRAGASVVLVGARMHPRARALLQGDQFDDLLRIAEAGVPAFELGVAPLGSRLRTVGELTLGARLDPDANRIRFDPFNTGPGLVPVTALNRLRAFAYPGSQRGWRGAPADDLSIDEEKHAALS